MKTPKTAQHSILKRNTSQNGRRKKQGESEKARRRGQIAKGTLKQ